MSIRGTALKYGDDINTDLIIPGRFLHIYDPDKLAEHAMADLDPEFHAKFSSGDIIVSGKNFGCGSSREQAAICLKYAGVGAIVASSFARIFFRNAVNLGIPIIEAETSGIESGHELDIDLTAGTIADLSTNDVITGQRLPEFLLDIIEAGGLIPHLKREP